MSDITSIAAAGIRASTAKFESSASRAARDPLANLPTELVEQSLAKTEFSANVAVLRTANKMAKSLLDILA